MGTPEVVLGGVIRTAREARGLTREEVADLADVSARQLGKIERGEAGSIRELLAVAHVLGVPLSGLASAAESLTPPQSHSADDDA